MVAPELLISTKKMPERRASSLQPVRAICITSGKGGVGKTNITVNLALALSRQHKRVMLLDADLGLANVDVMLGLKCNSNLSHVVRGERNLSDIILDGPDGLRIIPASSGVQRMAQLSTLEHAGVIGAFNELQEDVDILLIDSAAGISDSVVSFSRASNDVVIVVSEDPASFADAYALIKVLRNDYGVTRFHIIANRVSGAQAGRQLYDKLVRVAERFLDVTLKYMGAIPEDLLLQKAVKSRRMVVTSYPDSISAGAFRRIASDIARWPKPHTASGGLQFFFERLIQADRFEELLQA